MQCIWRSCLAPASGAKFDCSASSGKKYKPAGTRLLQAAHPAKYFPIVLAFQHFSRLTWRFGREYASRQDWSVVKSWRECFTRAGADHAPATAARVDWGTARGKEASRTFNRTTQACRQASAG